MIPHHTSYFPENSPAPGSCSPVGAGVKGGNIADIGTPEPVAAPCGAERYIQLR